MCADMIDVPMIERFRGDKARERREWDELRARSREDRTKLAEREIALIRTGYKGLSARSVRRAIRLLAKLIDRAMEDQPCLRRCFETVISGCLTMAWVRVVGRGG